MSAIYSLAVGCLSGAVFYFFVKMEGGK